MKRKSLLALMLVALVTPLANQSCTNLDEQVFDQLTEANFPRTEEEFVSSLGVAYTNLYGFANHNSYFSLQEISSDEMMIPQRGNDWFDGGQWLRVHRHEYNKNEESVNNGWNNLFSGVATCNRLIELFTSEVEKGNVDATLADGFISELRVLRGLYYFWLLDIYGNVPIVTAFAEAEAQPATKSRAEVYAFVKGELEANVPKLKKEKTGQTYARMNYYAGQALLAKLYLNAGVYSGTPEWAKASAAASEVINSGLYSLENNYFDNFKTENAGSDENIFVVPYDQVNAGGFNLPQMTLHYSSQGTFNLQAQPWNGYCTLQEFYDSYEDTDLRKNGPAGRGYGNFIVGPQNNADGTPATDSGFEPGDPDGARLTFTPAINEHFPNALRQAGARVGKFEYANGATPNLDNDFPILRYADILLTKAEAEHNLGNSAAALLLVNQVRARAGVGAFTELNSDNLLAERGREMFYEGWRRQDMIRLGKYNAPRQFKPGTSDPAKNLMPIPQNQISANPNLQQNPSY